MARDSFSFSGTSKACELTFRSIWRIRSRITSKLSSTFLTCSCKHRPGKCHCRNQVNGGGLGYGIEADYGNIAVCGVIAIDSPELSCDYENAPRLVDSQPRSRLGELCPPRFEPQKIAGRAELCPKRVSVSGVCTSDNTRGSAANVDVSLGI